MTCEETDMKYGVMNTYMFYSHPAFPKQMRIPTPVCKFIVKYTNNSGLTETYLCKLAHSVYIALPRVFEK